MIKSVCKLDSRIKSVDDIQTCLEYDDKFINEEGYFADLLQDFSDLDNCDYGRLTNVEKVPYYTNAFTRDGKSSYVFFLPKALLIDDVPNALDSLIQKLKDRCELHENLKNYFVDSDDEVPLYEEIIKYLTELQSIKEHKSKFDEFKEFDFTPEHEAIPVTLEVTKVYKFTPEFDLEE